MRNIVSVLLVCLACAGCVTDTAGNHSIDWTAVNTVMSSGVVTQAIELLTNLMRAKDGSTSLDRATLEASAWAYATQYAKTEDRAASLQCAEAVVTYSRCGTPFAGLLEQYVACPWPYRHQEEIKLALSHVKAARGAGK